MKTKLVCLAWIVTSIILLQPTISLAGIACSGIGGTVSTADCEMSHKIIDSGIGGTGHGGIGGTGVIANKAGIGGTGQVQNNGGIGGTGIVGIITGFGSIWVNGLEVQYGSQTQVAGNNSNINTLAIGQVVVVEAQGSNKELQANRISVVDAVAGQISSLNEAKGTITVLGQTVSVTQETIMQDHLVAQNTAKFNAGDSVKVSGLRLQNGEIVASRIEKLGELAESSVVGPITNIDGNELEIYGLKVRVPAGLTLRIDQEVVVRGSVKEGILMARDVTQSPSTQLYGRTKQINLQGYVGDISSKGNIKVGNLDVLVSESSIVGKEKQKTLATGELVQISGYFINDHSVMADRIEISRDRIDRVHLDLIGRSEHVAPERAEHVEREHRVERNERIDRPDRPDHADLSDIANPSEHSHE